MPGDPARRDGPDRWLGLTLLKHEKLVSLDGGNAEALSARLDTFGSMDHDVVPALIERFDGFAYDYRMKCDCGGCSVLTAADYFAEVNQEPGRCSIWVRRTSQRQPNSRRACLTPSS
ncbi:MAG: hypothetical protein ABI808_06515 [Pseudonocardiales bacterium]